MLTAFMQNDTTAESQSSFVSRYLFLCVFWANDAAETNPDAASLALMKQCIVIEEVNFM